MQVDPDLGEVVVPALSIQPIVENAIKHGVAAKPGPGWVRLTVESLTGRVRVSVQDSGAGFRPGAQSKGTGVGLENVRQRLSMMYGTAGDLAIESSSGGTTVTFHVPLATPAGECRPLTAQERPFMRSMAGEQGKVCDTEKTDACIDCGR